MDANYNTLRIWGGGNYENDEFYNMADHMGILLWHDMMFANCMFPGDQDFFDSIQLEITQNVKRLRNHPSIAVWVGNNEIFLGWKDWGWKGGLNRT